MNSKLESFYYIIQFFWLIGNLYIQIFKLDTKEIIETYYWIRIHIGYKASLKSKPVYTLKGIMISILGLSITILIIVGIVSLFYQPISTL